MADLLSFRDLGVGPSAGDKGTEPMSWTEKRVAVLVDMWTSDKSASEIAKVLGEGVTRNAVIGKAHRLGLSKSKTSKIPAGTRLPTGPESSEAPAPRMKAASDPDENAVDANGGKDGDSNSADTGAETDPVDVPMPVPLRKPIISATQPLPPQPSPNEVSEEALALVAQAEKNARRLELMQLTESTCKWPVGDPATADFWFCGLPSEAGKPYCTAHAALAYQPMSARRDRRSR